MKKILIIVLLSCFLMIPLRVNASDNGVAYRTWTTNNQGEIVPTQDAYLPNRIIYSLNVANSSVNSLAKAEDLYYEPQNQLFYLADTGNKRILVFDKSLKDAYQIGEGILQKPEGVYATSDGKIYVADYDAQKVFIFDASGNVVKEIAKPDHPLFGTQSFFRPSKIVVDDVGTMYIVDAGNANVLVQITSEGAFLGYFGANYITPNLSYVIRFMFSTKAQRAKMVRSPIAPTNLAINQDGLIHTVTRGLSGNALKKLNIAGNNLFPDTMYDQSDFNDCFVGPIGNIYTISESGYIYEYDSEGNLLFAFVGKDPTGKFIGLFANPRSIAVDENYRIYAIDHLNTQDYLQVFEPSEFADLVHTSIYYYQEGLYSESRVPWEQVLQRNNMFDLAHNGIGNAYLRESNYEEAMYHFRLAGNTSGYSDAFWEIRNLWIMTYGTYIFIGILAFALVLYIGRKTALFSHLSEERHRMWEKIKSVKIIGEVLYIGTFIKHPINGFYEVKKHGKMSVFAATILYFVFYVEMILSNVFTGFIFNPSDVETISIVKILFLSVMPIFLGVICNYLISSITEGCGRFKDVYIATICSFAPIILFYPFVIILSNVLTLNEQFIYQALKVFLWAWSFLLVYIMIKEIQELSFRENHKNIFITLITMILFVAFGFLLYMLGAQVVNFVKEVVIEVLSNG